MADLSLHDLSKKMAKLDFAMMATRSPNGTMTARPMSNNGDVEYRGDSYFFAYQDSRKIADLQADPHVTSAIPVPWACSAVHRCSSLSMGLLR